MSDNPFNQNEPLTTSNPGPDATGPEPVPDELLEKAVKLVQNVVKGNGLRGLQVALADFEGEVLKFETYELFRMDPQIAEKRVNGKQNGEVAGSVSDMRAKMQGVLTKITENPDIKKYVIDLLKKRNDIGFALENQTIALDSFNKSYVIHELCTSCSGSKALACGVCHGDGRATCYRCKGAMLVECPTCQGHRTVAAGGGRKTCMKCNGKGRAQCHVCRGRGVTRCKNCKGTGRLGCQQCGTTGWHSVIGSLVVKAKCSFWYDKEALVEGDKAPELPPLIDMLGNKMVLEKHADITLIEDAARLKELDQEAKDKEFKIPYKVRLPWGSISFRLKDKVVNAKLFGLHPELVHVDPFLEEPLFPGMRLLDEAARTSGNAVDKIKEASRFRAIGEALVLASRMSHGRAFEAYEKRYPFGLKTDTLHKILVSADMALKNVTKKPRRMGVIYAAIISLIVLSAFYATPVRSYLYAAIAIEAARVVIDILLLLTVMALSWVTIQSSAAKALQDAMAHLLPPEKRKRLNPKPGYAGWAGLGLAFMAWLAMVPITHMAEQSAPIWFEKMLSLIG